MARALYSRKTESLDKSEIYYDDSLQCIKEMLEDKTLTDFSAKVTSVIERNLKRFMAKRDYVDENDVKNFAEALATACTTKLSEKPSTESILVTAALLVSYNLKAAQKEEAAAEPVAEPEPA